jgi:hypothetical protein
MQGAVRGDGLVLVNKMHNSYTAYEMSRQVYTDVCT